MITLEQWQSENEQSITQNIDVLCNLDLDKTELLELLLGEIASLESQIKFLLSTKMVNNSTMIKLQAMHWGLCDFVERVAVREPEAWTKINSARFKFGEKQ